MQPGMGSGRGWALGFGPPRLSFFRLLVLLVLLPVCLPSSSEEDIGFSLVDLLFFFFFFPFVKQISKGLWNMRNSVWIPNFQ